MSTLDLRALARALGGEVAGHQVRAPGVGHSSRDRSLAVRLDARAPGGFLVHSFCGDDPLEAKDYVREKLGLRDATDEFSAESGGKFRQPSDDMARTAQAIAIWSEARDPHGTPVETYLNRRGLDLPNETTGGAIRFHPSCAFVGVRTPAMVCLVRDIVTDAPKAIHRTALSLDGCKVHVGHHDRLSLGPVGGGAIKLSPDEKVTLCLGIGEGVESVLSLRNLPEFGCSPGWSLISAGGVETFPVLPGIESLWLAVDHDETGIRAARSTARRWQASGAEAFLITPSAPGADLNDLFFAGQRRA